MAIAVTAVLFVTSALLDLLSHQRTSSHNELHARRSREAALINLNLDDDVLKELVSREFSGARFESVSLVGSMLEQFGTYTPRLHYNVGFEKGYMRHEIRRRINTSNDLRFAVVLSVEKESTVPDLEVKIDGKSVSPESSDACARVLASRIVSDISHRYGNHIEEVVARRAPGLRKTQFLSYLAIGLARGIDYVYIIPPDRLDHQDLSKGGKFSHTAGAASIVGIVSEILMSDATGAKYWAWIEYLRDTTLIVIDLGGSASPAHHIVDISFSTQPVTPDETLSSIVRRRLRLHPKHIRDQLSSIMDSDVAYYNFRSPEGMYPYRHTRPANFTSVSGSTGGSPSGVLVSQSNQFPLAVSYTLCHQGPAHQRLGKPLVIDLEFREMPPGLLVWTIILNVYSITATTFGLALTQSPRPDAPSYPIVTAVALILPALFGSAFLSNLTSGAIQRVSIYVLTATLGQIVLTYVAFIAILGLVAEPENPISRPAASVIATILGLAFCVLFSMIVRRSLRYYRASSTFESTKNNYTIEL